MEFDVDQIANTLTLQKAMCRMHQPRNGAQRDRQQRDNNGLPLDHRVNLQSMYRPSITVSYDLLPWTEMQQPFARHVDV